MSKKTKIESLELEDAGFVTELADGRQRVVPIVVGDDEPQEEVEIPEILPILTLRSSVLFPGAITPITVGRDKSIALVRAVNQEGGMLGAVLQRESEVDNPTPADMYRVGTAARIIKILEMPNGNLTVILNGLQKIEVHEYIATEPYFKARVSALRDSTPDLKSVEFEALVDSIRDTALGIINISPTMPKEAAFAIKNIDSKRGIINFICSNMELADEDRQALLEAPGLLARSRKLLEILIREQQLAELKNEIQERVKREIDKQQRDYYLQQQMRTIQEELGDTNDADLQRLEEAAAKKRWPKEVDKLFHKELQKLERINPAVAEYTVQITYLELLLELPWEEYTEDNLDLKAAREQLDRDHFGLEEVKDRILEHLAVIKLKGDLKSPILCLYGPPGVGKTSLGKSVAAALGRKFGRISLGGLHDESEIRGHRRTYIGAMPGRIIQTIKRCGSSNPVIILDEVDKLTVSNHGDPSSALLEVLDPEQNTTFHDNYIDVEYDLSKVLFIATANNIQNIAPALRDRMEMINIPGYLMEEKISIALEHLLQKQREAHGIQAEQMTLSAATVEQIIGGYTRESGVRSLDKQLAKLARSRAKQIAFEEAYEAEISAEEVQRVLGMPKFLKDEYEVGGMTGVVTGLAWTEVGGDILYIESVLTPGKGALSLTGNLGDVMKESATIAYEWVKAHHEELGIDPVMFEKHDLNIHVPEGAIPKDGPSAGITMLTSIVSTFTKRQVKERIAMTGETTLRGRVTPVGGVKEKILAAKRAGIHELILSEENRKDVAEIKADYIEGLTFHYVRTNDEVLRLALI
ncbi:MAG: endopeptidase La [Alistipes sp.]|nr:endopeptidase La [Alistipes sp.]MBR3773879.1 endopeptidase La [Alistipes sp.]MBR4052725.1 endopeptidase La [Alistipes sp.]